MAYSTIGFEMDGNNFGNLDLPFFLLELDFMCDSRFEGIFSTVD